MRRLLFLSLIAVVAFMFGSSADAQLSAPSWADPCAQVVDNCQVCDENGENCESVDGIKFDWDSVDGANKYSVDVEVPIDLGDDGTVDCEVELSFGTSDRLDGAPINQTDLCVPLTEFVGDVDCDYLTANESLEGIDAFAKVKGLNPPSKGKGNNQKNTWSGWCGPFTIEAPAD